MAPSPQVGDRVSYDGATCTVRYAGEVAGASGSWLGVEWDDAARGKHDGSHKGVRYFTCLSRSATAASFVRPTRPTDRPTSFIGALQDKYASELASTAAIQFSGKVAEEVGFEKIRRKQAQLSELRYVVLDEARICAVYSEGDQPITETCPKVVELDLSRNLFKKIGTVVAICSELPRLRNLRLNGNRFQGVLEDDGLDQAGVAFQNVEDLALEQTLMTWEETIHVAAKCRTLAALNASANQLLTLPPTPLSSLASTLTSLNLEFNEFTALDQLASLSELSSLRHLQLKGNNISATRLDNAGEKLPIFSTNLQFLDISYNKVSSWAFVDELPTCFPGLTALRFAHNPVYENPDPELAGSGKNLTEEAYMFTVGRLANLKTLNFSAVSALDRQNAEMFYLARIGKQLASVPAEKEPEVIRHHRRYAELCELYGPPVVNRTREVNPAFLEARLVTVQFTYHGNKDQTAVAAPLHREAKVPKSFDIYAVKGIAGRLFNAKPLALRLVWETGEWDPVGGFDEEVEDSSDDDEGTLPREQQLAAGTTASADTTTSQQSQERAGKWVKREVELVDGPRQLGFCVDGMEAKIRVELR
ncbi:hypothetical protein F5Y17DRAFT_75298 [Xylariaceae sp. FL0594]|nr:hypothetical protein F5Y17DRAFT_75298 [Xylariaceae sp. FL0594]